MNDAVTDRNKIDLLRFTQPVAGFLGGRRKVRHLFNRIGLVNQWFLVRPGSAQPRPGANAVHLAFNEAIEIAARAGREDLKLETRGASIDDENCVHRFTRRQPPPSFGGHRRKARRPQRMPCGYALNRPAMSG